MNAQLDQIVNALLYEGYILYPYRPSAQKNSRERFTFGRVYPELYCGAQNGAEPCVMQTECLLSTRDAAPVLTVSLRFLQPQWRDVGVLPGALAGWPDGGEPVFKVVPQFSLEGTLYQTWQEAVERTVAIPPISLSPGQKTALVHDFSFAAARQLEPLPDGQNRVAAVLVRRHEALAGTVEIRATPWDERTFKISVRILNRSAIPGELLLDNDAVLLRTFASTHTILSVTNGEFLSLMDPPAEYQEAAAACHNTGAWPVLVGDEPAGQRDTLLSSPIILYDYPKVAPESCGDFCDGTEIDEMLALRVLTMTDEEKRAMRDADPFARRILERTETLPSGDFLRLHGVIRDPQSAEEFFNPSRRMESVLIGGVSVKAGDRVRLHPKGRADAFDLFLNGKTAVVEAVEQDAESCVHVAVVVADDPGKDFGWLRQPGHRFFYRADEIEPLPEAAP